MGQLPSEQGVMARLAPPAHHLLDPANFATRFAATEPRNRTIRALQRLLWALGRLDGFGAKVEWLEDLASWVFDGGKVPGRKPEERFVEARLRVLFTALDELPEEAEALKRVAGEVFAHTDPVRLFTDTGIPSRPGFFGEAFDRLSKSLLPAPGVDHDTARLLLRLFPDARRVKWLESLPPEELTALLARLGLPDATAKARVDTGMREAAVLLGARIASLGIADDFRARLARTVHASPFLALAELVKGLAPGDAEAELKCREGIGACRKAVKEVESSLDQTGVSVDLVYRIELLKVLLDRLYSLVTLLGPSPPEGAGRKFALVLARGGVRDRSLGELLRSSSALLAQRVVESAGQGGEHYVTRSRKEQHQMVDSAGGGGAVVALAVFNKFAIGWAGLPILFNGLAVGLNYAVAFVSMHVLGLTLATKQPAMTAAHLAAAIDQTTRAEAKELGPLVELVVRTFRSQLAAFVGNLGIVIPVAAALDGLWWLFTGEHYLSMEYATKVVNAHHPLFSRTVLWALFTGVYLWFASIVAGTVENWFVVRQLPDALATNRRLRSLLGNVRAQRLSKWLLKNVSGLSGNLFFGFTLGMVPFFVNLLGLDWEVRHITFVCGQLTFAGLRYGRELVLDAPFLWAVASIFIVGFCNFAVSFALALTVALRARDVGAVAQLGLVGEVMKRFWKAPLDFVRAPANEPDARGDSPH